MTLMAQFRAEAGFNEKLRHVTAVVANFKALSSCCKLSVCAKTQPPDSPIGKVSQRERGEGETVALTSAETHVTLTTYSSSPTDGHVNLSYYVVFMSLQPT